jgi:hypothetical protein
VITRDEAETLIQGKIPGVKEPTPKPAPIVAPPPPNKPDAPASKYVPPKTPISSRVPSILKVLMEQYHQVKVAVFFERTEDHKVFLGLGMRYDNSKVDPILRSTREVLTRLGQPIEVIELKEGMEGEILETCKPFYQR